MALKWLRKMAQHVHHANLASDGDAKFQPNIHRSSNQAGVDLAKVSPKLIRMDHTLSEPEVSPL